MGVYLSSEFYICARDIETDRYENVDELKEGNPMSRFKHETYAYGLNKKHKQYKTLYLYCGYNRIAKTSRSEEGGVMYINIDFSTAEAALEWDQCQEQIASVAVDIAWLERTFSQHYVEMNDDDVYRRRYQNYRMSMQK